MRHVKDLVEVQILCEFGCVEKENKCLGPVGEVDEDEDELLDDALLRCTSIARHYEVMTRHLDP